MKDYIKTSIFDAYKTGPGPSSSHTIGPMKAAFDFKKRIEALPENKKKKIRDIKVHLYGSLSATGKGHGTDRSIIAGLLGFEPETCDIGVFNGLLKNRKKTYKIKLSNSGLTIGNKTVVFDKVKHSFPSNNTIIFKLYGSRGVILEKEYYSIGGGFINLKGQRRENKVEPLYKFNSMTSLKSVMKRNKVSLGNVILRNEKLMNGKSRKEVLIYLDNIIDVMKGSVERGIKAKGLLPGTIKLSRKAATLYKHALKVKGSTDRDLALLNAYALAASEENAAGNRIVTAPTSGSSGVIPAVIYFLSKHSGVTKKVLREGLIVAAAIEFIAKHNASIAGAEVGCQGEIGVASSMAAALISHVNGYPAPVIESAAEIALEHHLGLTCDPIGGYVQIPCIERNAVGAVSAYNAYILASLGDYRKQKIGFDKVVKVMMRTGRDMSAKYKETSKGGLALCSITC